MEILRNIIIINVVVTTIWTLIRLIRQHDIKFAIMFYFVPVLGFLLYYIPRWGFFVKRKVGYDRASLVSRISIDNTVGKIDLQKAFEIVPIQDALVAGSDMEKRQLLLNRLKKDMVSSYTTIKEAKSDRDSESVHYVSAVRMELYNKFYRKLEEAKEEYQKHPEQKNAKKYLLSCMSDFIQSDLLQEIEKCIYMKQFCDFFSVDEKKENIFAYNDYLVFLCELKQEKDIFKELHNDNVIFWTYRTYKELLSYFYNKKEKDSFYWVIDKLRSSKLILDQEGLEMIRYWELGGKKDVVD